MTALLLGILAPALTELGVANNARVLAVEEDILERFLLKVASLQDILEIGLGEACRNMIRQSMSCFAWRMYSPLDLISASEQ